MNRPNGQQCLAKAIELRKVVHEELAECAAAGNRTHTDGRTDGQTMSNSLSGTVHRTFARQ